MATCPASSRSVATASPTLGDRPARVDRLRDLWAFGGDTHALIPLYSVGVFLCFTLSQLGMVKHWLHGRETGWRWRLAVNAAGGVLTAVVLAIVVSRSSSAARTSL